MHTCYNLISQSIFYTFLSLRLIIRTLVVKMQELWYNICHNACIFTINLLMMKF